MRKQDLKDIQKWHNAEDKGQPAQETRGAPEGNLHSMIHGIWANQCLSEEERSLFGAITKSRGEIEKEIEHLSQNRRNIDELIAHYSEIGLFNMPVKDFMALFDAEYTVKVEKKKVDTDELYITDINGKDLAGCAGLEHLNKVMTGYLLKKLMMSKEQEKEKG